MKDKFCCNQWVVFGPKAREVITDQLKETEPKYLVKPILSWLNTIDSVCPTCGEPLKEGDLPESTKKRVKKEASRTYKPHCPYCKGKKVDKDGNSCQGCLGTGDMRNGVRKRVERAIE